jgi:predicted GNAT family N-acyltransferase
MNASNPRVNGSSQTQGLRARLACTEGDRVAAARLRYEVYIAEQQKPYPEADHVRRLLLDDLDHESDVLLVEDSEGFTVGTVRSSALTAEGTASRYSQVFQIERLRGAIPREEICVCSRLAVLPGYRFTKVKDMLFEEIYKTELTAGIRLCFATCARRLVRLFASYGFREFAETIEDNVTGTLHRMLLVLDDVEYLAQIGSPFLAVAIRHGIEREERPAVSALFEEYEAIAR